MRVLLACALLWFITAYDCQLEPEYGEYIKEAFEMYENEGITNQMIQDLHKVDFIYKCIAKFQNGTHSSDCIQSHNYYRQQYTPIFEEFAPQMPDMELFMTMGDGPFFYKNKCEDDKLVTDRLKPCNCDPNFKWPKHSFFQSRFCNKYFEKIPTFAPSFVRGCNLDIIIPSVYHLYEKYPNQLLNVPWEQKKFKAFWRGSISDIGFLPEGMKLEDFSHRLRLLNKCRSIPDCDALHVGYYMVPQEWITRRFMLRFPRACMTNTQKLSQYKIILDIDGATFSARFPKILQTGSAIFKMKTFQDVGTLGAIPWKHYVPVNMDLSDLQEKLEWARNNDDKLKEIAENGRQFSLRMHNKEAYKCYFYHLLLKYIELLKKGGSLQN